MSISLKWGLIMGIVYVIFSLISNMLGIQAGAGGGGMASAGIGLLLNSLLFLVTLAILYLALKEIREEELDGFLNLGQAIRKGMKIALIAGLILAVYMLLYAYVIDPHMMDKAAEAMEATWDKMNVPEEQREMSRKIAMIFMHPLILAPMSIIWVAFWGLIKSLIAGSMLKKDPTPTIPPAL